MLSHVFFFLNQKLYQHLLIHRIWFSFVSRWKERDCKILPFYTYFPGIQLCYKTKSRVQVQKKTDNKIHYRFIILQAISSILVTCNDVGIILYYILKKTIEKYRQKFAKLETCLQLNKKIFRRPFEGHWRLQNSHTE